MRSSYVSTGLETHLKDIITYEGVDRVQPTSYTTLLEESHPRPNSDLTR